MRKFFFTGLLVLLFFGLSPGKDIVTLEAEGEGELIYPIQIEEGPDGNIYVSDVKDYYIKTYSPKGQYIRKIGGRGEGPGMMKRMGRFGFSLDKKFLFFTEFFNGHRWFTFTDLEGKYKKAFKLNIPGFFGILDTLMISENRFISRVHFLDANRIKKKAHYFEYPSIKKLVILNEKGKIEKEIVCQDYVSSISMIGDGADITLPFPPVFLWAILKNEIVFSDGLSTNLSFLNYQGEKVAELKTSLPEPEKVTDEDLEKWRRDIKASSAYQQRRGMYRFSGKVIDLYTKSIFEKKPNISSLSTTPDGSILIGGRTVENQSKSYWLINEKGKTLCEVVLKAQLVKITRHFIFLKTTDKDDNIYVSFMDRGESEGEGLRRLEKLMK